MNIDYSDHEQCKNAILKAQADQRDQRQQARECTTFLTKKNGMWEPEVYNKMRGRPRYQFDMISPVIDNIVGNFEKTSRTWPLALGCRMDVVANPRRKACPPPWAPSAR